MLGGIAGTSHPPVLSTLEAEHFGAMEPNGGFPAGFLDFAYEKMGVTDPDRVLHLCAGTLRRGVRVDLRPETSPTYLCDARHTPFSPNSFDWVLSDPPPFPAYTRDVYGLDASEHPLADEILLEARRVLRKGGKACVLVPYEPTTPEGMERTSVHALLLGPGYTVRAAFFYRKV